MYRTLDLLSDSSERVAYNCPNLPVNVEPAQLSNFLNFSISNHWHDDIEFNVILSGRMSYSINGAIHTIEQGDGVFVNSRQFHGNFSADGTDCDYFNVLFHPVLLCANQFLEKTYVVPVITNDAFPYAILHQSIPWEAELLRDLHRIYQLYSKKDKAANLLIQSQFFHLWSILYVHMPDAGQPSVRSSNRLSVLREMTGFLQKNYCEKITLGDIAAAGKVCQSNCCEIFNEYLHQTPIQYLIGYRLNKSTELLKSTSMNITEIAMASGFASVSYYAETFRKYFGCSPTEYRKRKDPEPEEQK